MRLTLRTLLAYLDDILDPADAQVLGNKIGESEFATALVQQIRESVRRLRLGAPALDAQGIGSELNSVAEYLDNVLPPDQVPALEKACLDDEINLGEVASCHQILTLVLGEAAPVTDTMRRAAYGIAQTVALQDNGEVQKFAHAAHPAVPPPISPITDPSPTLETPPASETSSAPSAGHTVIRRIDGPSTKETWRAETSAIEAEQASGAAAEVTGATATEVTEAATARGVADCQIAVEATTVSKHDSAANQPARRPDYMPRPSSRLRPAILTTVIALLILAGLLFATGTLQDNLLTRWMGTSPQAADNREVNRPRTEGSTPPPREVTEPPQPSTNEDQEVKIVSPNLQEPDPTGSVPGSASIPDQVTDSRHESSRFFLDGTTAADAASLEAELIEPSFGADPEPNFDAGREPNFDVDSEPNFGVGPESNFDADREPVLIEPSPENGLSDESGGNREAVLDASTHVDVATQNNSADEVSPEFDLVGNSAGESLSESGGDRVSDAISVLPIAEREISDEDSIAAVPIEPAVAASPDVEDLAIAATGRPSSFVNLEATDPVTVDSNGGQTRRTTSLRKDDQLLLLFDEPSETWQRVTSTMPLQENQHLLGMPAFRADLELGENLICSTHGVARLRLGPGNDVTVLDGRLILNNLQDPESQGIRFRGRRFEVQMLDPGTNVAIEAYHEYVPGTDISAGPPHAILKIHPLDNSIVVQQGGNLLDVPKGRYLFVLDDFEPRVHKSSRTLKWMKADYLKIDRYTRDQWQTELGEITDMRAWLQQKAQNNRAQQVSLAARCLAEMDDFSAIVGAIGSDTQSGGQYWMEHFQTLRSALTRGETIQSLVQIQLEQTYGKDQAALMMEMLRGYNDKQLAAGSAELLVRHLENPLLEMRVLAIENLFEITGARSDYRAAASPTTRVSRVKAWQKRLQSGRVHYSETPDLVRLLEISNEEQAL